MKEFNSVDEILEFAISEEENAEKFYSELAEKMTNESMKKVFIDFAREEKGHKARLLEVKKGKIILLSDSKVNDLKLSDYFVDVEPRENITVQEAFVLAMKKEKAAFKLYSDLADQTEDENYKDLFLNLAQEEAKHKLKFEIEYDEQFNQEN